MGAGVVGRIHARSLVSHPRTALVGICGRSSRRAEELARSYGVPAFRSVEDMMAAESPDVVCVATGNKDHVEPTLAALEGGADVFVEKPLAFELEGARAMVDAARRAGRILGVDFNHRFSAPYRRALELLRTGELGRVCYVDMKFAGDLYTDLNDPYCQLIETQVHSFDLMRLFAGEIEQVSAFLGDPQELRVFTSSAVSLSFRGGAVGTLLGSWDASYRQPHAQILEVCGTEGRVVVDNVVDAVHMYRSDGDVVAWRPGLFDSAARDFWRTIDAHVAAFVDALVEGTEVPVSGGDGLRALEVTYAAIESHRRGTIVRLQ